jgi:integrase
MGVQFSAHDLRRTLAQLMRRAGVELEQVQYILGHSNVVTTERYLGGSIELEQGKAGVDKVEW